MSDLAVEISDLSFRYPEDQQWLLDGIDVELARGAFALLVGDTGSGKSTLLRLLKPALAPAGEIKGSVRLCGQDVYTASKRDAACVAGLVLQDPESQIVCDSVGRELAFGLESVGTDPQEMRRRIAETCYFLGIETWLHNECATLSGGQKQMVALAGVLAMRPQVLLLDEPTAQLDPVAAHRLLHAVFRINRELGTTVVVATHDPRLMHAYATEAYCLHDGKLHLVEDMACLEARLPLFEGSGFDVLASDASAFGVPASEDPASEDLAFDALAMRFKVAGPNRSQADRRNQKAAVVLRDVWHRYNRNAPWVLRGLTVQVEYGRVHALVGGNGSGKSTILSLAAQALRPVRGRVVCAAGQRVGLLPQDPRLLFTAETVKDELAEWMAPDTSEDVLALLDAWGLKEFAHTHPQELSGGQRQLLGLAKVFASLPSVLLLDEPSKGLDGTARRRVAYAIRSYARAGAAVMMATHDLDFAQQVADDVSMVFDGAIACSAPSEEFFCDNICYRP